MVSAGVRDMVKFGVNTQRSGILIAGTAQRGASEYF
jgi:hypothetical protein